MYEIVATEFSLWKTDIFDLDCHKIVLKTGMCPTLWIYVDFKKEEMVIKERKQIKIELRSAF